MNMKPYREYVTLTCGCCTGDGTGNHPGNDQCVCAMHQDVPLSMPVHVCAYHTTVNAVTSGTDEIVDYDSLLDLHERQSLKGR